MKMFDSPMPLNSYLNRKLECDCGHDHYAPIETVEIGPGALNKLPDCLKAHAYLHPYILCDRITYDVAGRKCEEILKSEGIDSKLLIISHLGFDEATLGEIIINLPENCDVMIGVGTGSITDMLRYSSFKLRLPCITIATGAPMDGFAASVGIMNVNNMKRTMNAHTTQTIIGDTDILKTAPYRMTVAGFGDLIGKITCLNDWELSRIINGEHYCEKIVELVSTCVDDVLSKASLIKLKDPEALGNIMEGLVLSGTAISLYGTSRPASGAEHHMSHFWETIMDQRHDRSSMHGEQVAVGTVLVLMLAEELRRLTPDFSAARKAAEAYSASQWTEKMKEVYGPAAEEIISLEEKSGKNNTENVLKRIGSIETHWEEIVHQLEKLPSSEYLYSILSDIGCPALPEEIGIDDELLKNTFLYCKEVRDRYTIFQLAYDLNVLNAVSDNVIARIKALRKAKR